MAPRNMFLTYAGDSFATRWVSMDSAAKMIPPASRVQAQRVAGWNYVFKTAVAGKTGLSLYSKVDP